MTLSKHMHQPQRATLLSLPPLTKSASNDDDYCDVRANVGESESHCIRTNSTGDARPRMKSECVFYCQYAALLLVILACLFNLTFRANEVNVGVWNSLLAASLGIILPNPSIKR